MGWTNSVDILQNFIRRFLVDACGVPPGLEVRKDRPFPLGAAAVVCMDGFDLISKVKVFRDHLQGATQQLLQLLFAGNVRSSDTARFVSECSRRGLPLNSGKSVMKSFCSAVRGGEFDGVEGKLMHARDKGFRFLARSLIILSLAEIPQVSAQHWCGLFCFM